MRVEKLLERLRREFIKVNLIQASLDSLLFFLGANLVLFVFNLNLLSGFSDLNVLIVITSIFFVGDLYYRTRNYSLEIYERQNPELKEILRTARDNLDRQNIASQALFDEVLDRARTVTSESIIPSQKIVQKILAVGILSFLTVISGIADLQLQQTGGDVIPGGEQLKQLIDQDKDDGFELRNASEIYGDEKEIDAENLDIEFNIEGSGESGETGSSSPTGSTGELLLDTAGESLNEDLDLAKEYSLAIKDLES